MNKILFYFMIFTLNIYIYSCITPPTGVCAYNSGENIQIEVISIEEKKDIDLKCQNRTTLKFKYYKDNKTDNIIYSQDYPDYFIKNNSITIKKYDGLLMKPLNKCSNPKIIFTFNDYKESFGYLCK
ncbi:MAG: hypothetical protein U0354_11700 [Candidatus Sericytochromatia bacterium]